MYFINQIANGILWLLLSAVQLFFGYIDICDALLTTLLIWLTMHYTYNWDSWWALALGLSVSLILYIIFKHRIGFWFASVLYSITWGIFLTTLTCMIFFPNIEEKWYWTWIVVVGIISLVNHYGAYWRKLSNAELDAEDATKTRR